MKEVSLPPEAGSFSESMRDIGYSLETAVADIIDNSITAKATKVEIWFDNREDHPELCIVDNGSGMNEKELLAAMRPGSRNPRSEREKNDLGRFGLGMKTASFSQCKKLTVVTRKDGIAAAAIWDLSVVAEKNDWIASLLDQNEISNIPCLEKLPGDGTLILWEDLDRLCENGPGYKAEDLIYEKLHDVSKHLSLVFHLFLNGEVKGSRKLEININGNPVEPFDPFCRQYPATQALNREVVRIDGEEMLIQPYVLPHHSKLTMEQLDFYKKRSDFVNYQGGYIYRNGRLMAWGSWFGLIGKGEATKLARVRIDFPNALDEHWTIDIKKSRAQPPQPVREKLKQIIGRISEQSTRVHVGRGKKLTENISFPIWRRHPSHDGIKYTLDNEHPMITGYGNLLEGDKKTKFKELLTIIERSIPVEAIYSDYSLKPKDFDFSEPLPRDEIDKKLEVLFQILSENGQYQADKFREIVMSLRPFSDHKDSVESYIEKKFNL